MNAVRIHGVQCSLVRVGDCWHVIRNDTSARIAEGSGRFLAIANAARLLHTPRRAA